VSTTRIIPTPSCISFPESASGWNINYVNQYSGSLVLASNNAGNTNGDPVFTTYAGTLDVCSAAQQCASFAANAVSTSGGGIYYTFNLIFREVTQDWLCTAYYDDANPSDYNQVDANVKYSYGYAASE
jgi:hypothetical protein